MNKAQALAASYVRPWNRPREVARLNPRVHAWFNARADMIEAQLRKSLQKSLRDREPFVVGVRTEAVRRTLKEFIRRREDPEFVRFILTDA